MNKETDVVRYYVPKFDPDFKSPHELPETCWDQHSCMCAQEVAEEYFSNCDGCEDKWPIVFVLESEDGKRSTWSVECVIEPSFYASRTGEEEKDTESRKEI